MAVVDSYSESNVNIFQTINTTNFDGYAQAFTGDGSTLDSATFYIKRFGSPTGNASYKVYAHTGTFGTSSKPTGSALATSGTIDVSTISTTESLVTLNFSGANRITLINGTKYCVSIEWLPADSSNGLSVGDDSSSPTHSGNMSHLDGSSWTADSGHDLAFSVNGTAASTNTSAGFFM